MRVLFADNLPQSARQRLAAAGFDVHADPSLTGEALSAALVEIDPAVLVVRSTRVEEEHVEAGKTLALVVRAGAGINTIDLEACSAQGIFVSNCPGKNADAVAELTIGLLVSLDRRIPDNVIDLRAGTWNKKAYSRADGLKGRTLGVLGTGRIGQEVIRRAQAFGMRVIAWSRSLDDRTAGAMSIERLETPEQVAAECDALTVHLALASETHHLIGSKVFDAMKPGTMFINTSRAEVVDEEAMMMAIQNLNLRVAVDVLSGEPKHGSGPFSHPLADRIYATHHIGASTEQAQQAVADEACRVIEVYMRTGRAPNCVNLATRTDADHTLVVRHRDRVGVLATVLDQLQKDGINVQDMENTVFEGGEAASARIQVVGRPADDVIGAMRAHEDIFHVEVVAQ